MPWFLILAIAVLASIWTGVLIRRCGLLGGCLGALLAGSCFGHPFFHAGALTVDRILLLAVAVVYFAQRNLFGLPAKRLRRSDVLFLVFLGILIISTFTHHWQVEDFQPVATLLFFYLMPFTLYWVASRCRLSESSVRGLLIAFTGFGVYLSLTAVCEVVGLRAIVFPRYVGSSAIFEFLGRARGPFLNPVGNGFYMTLCLISTTLLWPHVRSTYRPLVIGSALLILVGLACTLTRSVWLGAILALCAAVFATVPKQHRLRVTLAAVILGAAGWAAMGSNLLRFKRDQDVSLAQMEESAKLRPILAAFAYEVFQAHPWQGLGFGQYRRESIDFLTQRSFDLPMEKAKDYIQHNVFLSLLTETGIFGMLSLILLLLVLGWDAWGIWQANGLALWQRQVGLQFVLLLVAFVPNGMFHETSIIVMFNALLFFSAGLVRNVREDLLTTATARPRRASVAVNVPSSGWSAG